MSNATPTATPSTAHPIAACMAAVIPTLTPLPGPTDSIRGLSFPFYIHNALRCSTQCISRYLATFTPESNVDVVQQAAKECRQWVDWYMPFLHHHHRTEDEYWFPVYRKAFVEAGVPEADVNAVFDRWDGEHKSIIQHEETMLRNLDALTCITASQLSQALSSCQQSTRDFSDFLSSHLGSEEQYLIQKLLNENRITEKKAQEFQKTFTTKILSKDPVHQNLDNLTFMLTPLGPNQEQQILKLILPFPVRLYYNWFARPSYIKRSSRLYALAHGLVQS